VDIFKDVESIDVWCSAPIDGRADLLAEIIDTAPAINTREQEWDSCVELYVRFGELIFLGWIRAIDLGRHQ